MTVRELAQLLVRFPDQNMEAVVMIEGEDGRMLFRSVAGLFQEKVIPNVGQDAEDCPYEILPFWGKERIDEAPPPEAKTVVRIL